MHNPECKGSMNWKLWAALQATLLVTACDKGGGTVDPPPVDPPAPVQLSVVGQGGVTERYTSEVAVAGDWVYTGTWSARTTVGNALKIWNAASGTPVLVDSIIIPNARTLGDVQISQDGSLLVVPAEARTPADGIYLFDRSNPARPTPISQFVTTSTQGGVHTVKLGTVGGRHYAFLSINPWTGPARLVIVDITNPANPTQVFERTMGLPYVHDVFVRDGLLFTALWDDGMTIWDIGGGGRGGTPANPVQLGNVKTLDGNVHNIHWVHDPTNNSKRFAFVGQEEPGAPFAGDIHVVDVSNLTAPREVAFFHVQGAGVHNFAVDEPSGMLYAAFYNGGVRALDVRGNLGNCVAAA